MARGFQFTTEQDAQYIDLEVPRHDALGNIYSMSRSEGVQVFERAWLDAGSASTSSSNTLWKYQPGTGRLLLRMTPNGVDSTHYDAGGNIVFTNQSATVGSTAFDRASFYDAEGRLRRAETRRVENFGARTPPFYLVSEEYRYDALGRRIVVHTRKDCKNNGQDLRPCAVGTLRRTVWEGTAELYDIQVPVSSDNTLVNIFFTAAEMENDTAWVRSSLGNWDGFDPHPMYGRVAYTYGHAIDKPLSIVRMNYADRPYGQGYHAWVEPFAIVPHWNMRGAAQTGTYASGERQRCKPVDGTTRCVYLDWHAGWFPYSPARPVPEHWHGSLLNEKRDASGLLYRRNRYYDPSSSRFTQEDPIGLAGGLNVYGFAAGDPVTYSDPYGLCPYGQRNRDTNTADCPDDQVGDAVRNIDQYGGDEGDATIRSIADRRLNPARFDPQERDRCGGYEACQAGKTLWIRNGLDDGSVAGHIVHETTHEVLSLTYGREEHRAWQRTLTVMSGFPEELRGPTYGPQVRIWSNNPTRFHIRLEKPSACMWGASD